MSYWRLAFILPLPFFVVFCILLCVALLSNASFDILCCNTESCGNLCMLSVHARLFRVFCRRNKKENRVWWWWWRVLSYLYFPSQLRPCLHPPSWTIPFLHKSVDAQFGVPPNCFSDILNCSTTHCGIYNGWVCGWMFWVCCNWNNEEWRCGWW